MVYIFMRYFDLDKIYHDIFNKQTNKQTKMIIKYIINSKTVRYKSLRFTDYKPNKQAIRQTD